MEGLSTRVEYKHDEKASVRLQAGARLIREAAQAADQADARQHQALSRLHFGKAPAVIHSVWAGRGDPFTRRTEHISGTSVDAPSAQDGRQQSWRVTYGTVS